MIKKKNDYISDGLIQIRDKLKSIPEEQSQGIAEDVSPGGDKVFKKALRKRYDDFSKARRDLITRYTESITVLTEDSERFKQYIQELDKFHSQFQAGIEELEQMEDAEEVLADDSAALAEAARKVENLRLTLIRDNVRIGKTISHNTSGGAAAEGGSVIYELASLSFRQLIKLGTGFLFPVYAAVVVAALIIAAVIVLSMGIL